VQNADNHDVQGSPEGSVWGGIGGAHDLSGLTCQRVDVLGPVVPVSLPAPGALGVNEFAFVAALVPGIYQIVASYTARAEIDQELYLGPPPKTFADTDIQACGSAGDPVDLSALAGSAVTLVVQCGPWAPPAPRTRRGPGTGDGYDPRPVKPGRVPSDVARRPAGRLVPGRLGRPGDDPIFALNAEASARKARGEAIVNATLGSLLNDDGSLAILPTAARAVKEVLPVDWATYAPIPGSAPFLQAVARDLFGRHVDLLGRTASVATPGGSGALRHAVASFLEPGQSLLTTSFFWGPYQTIADEHDRRVSTFRMFDASGGLDVDALDAALASTVSAQGRVLLFLNDPCHNPTGYSMDASEWTRVAEAIGRHAETAPVTVLLDAAYSEYGPSGGRDAALSALAGVADRALVLVAWTASKTFTHYGLRVGALVALVPDATERAEIQNALTYACRGTWSNCNRGGMAAVARLLTDPDLSRAVRAEREALVRLLGERVAAFNDAARRAGLRHPRYDGGFFTTVFADAADRAALALKEKGVFVVPQKGALRLGLCAVPRADVPRLVTALADAIG
jgi:aromatic-amino-acid transaminase